MKAQITIDMPEYCDDGCPCLNTDPGVDNYFCSLAWRLETDENAPRNKWDIPDADWTTKRPDWCPLQPVDDSNGG